jgi:gamma-glutamylcyclotransferase
VAVFAYGSNMLTAWIHSRALVARPLATALLEGSRLRWNKRSAKDGSGKCTIEGTGRNEDLVWGVIYLLDPADKTRLDRAEGLGRGYEERTVTVVRAGNTAPALAYFAMSVDLNVTPFDWYQELVVAGAREHGLPLEYIATLQDVLIVTDPDAERAAHARKFLGDARSKPMLNRR